jgi:hypothetical protein
MARPRANRFGNIGLRKRADKSTGSREAMLVLPPGSFEQQDDGTIVITNPAAAEQRLVNPDTPGYEHEPWPLEGVELEEAPERAKLPYSWVQRGVGEGWLELVNQRVVHRPGGPASDPWRVTHTFVQADEVIFHCIDGDWRYTVVENPDKYAGSDSDEVGEAGSQDAAVYWSYHVVKEA